MMFHIIIPLGSSAVKTNISVKKILAKLNAFFNTLIFKGRSLGCVTHYFFKKVWSKSSTSSSSHCVDWRSSMCWQRPSTKCVELDQERITCWISAVSTDPELHKLVNRYERHKCSEKQLLWEERHSSAIVTGCRFVFHHKVRDSGERSVI